MTCPQCVWGGAHPRPGEAPCLSELLLCLSQGPAGSKELPRDASNAPCPWSGEAHPTGLPGAFLAALLSRLQRALLKLVGSSGWLSSPVCVMTRPGFAVLTARSSSRDCSLSSTDVRLQEQDAGGSWGESRPWGRQQQGAVGAVMGCWPGLCQKYTGTEGGQSGGFSEVGDRGQELGAEPLEE